MKFVHIMKALPVLAVSVTVLGVVILPVLLRSGETCRCAGSCESCLKQWALACKIYALETPGGVFPPSS